MVIARLHPDLFYLFPKDREYIIPFLGKYRMHAQPLFGIERNIMAGGYELEVIGIVQKYVKPGMIAMDIGANVGAISIALADKVGPDGMVFSFEPGPATFSRLERNLSLNPSIASIISPQNMGCSEKNGVMVYHELAHARGNATLGDLDAEWEAYESHEVAVIKIDSFVAEKGLRKVDFMKVDVERMEFNVLLGAKLTLEKFHPVICYETLPDMGGLNMTGGENFKRIQILLNSLGYNLYRVEGDHWSEKATPENFTLNILAVAGAREGR
jgi:FkbM family methyltransferase